MTQPYDVIFIGSGIGSLAAASLLSQWEIGLRGCAHILQPWHLSKLLRLV
jgi:hypothetical protein